MPLTVQKAIYKLSMYVQEEVDIPLGDIIASGRIPTTNLAALATGNPNRRYYHYVAYPYIKN